jgi:1,4-dihydroxy-2-naphthoate octaprenyltransferase
MYLAWKVDRLFQGAVFFWGSLAVFLILLSTYHAGEYFDRDEDCLSKSWFNSRFAGGSGIIPSGILSAAVPFWTSILSLLAAFVIGLVLQFHYQTGPYTLLLGALGALPGFFYSTRPIRLVERGVGELFIAFCYGWLPVATGFYLQAGYFHPLIHWLSIPVGLSIFNVILLNEFPDYEADKAVGKKNLLVRLGPKAGIVIYVVATATSWLTMATAVGAGVSAKVWFVYFPVLILSAIILFLIAKKWQDKPQSLEVLCGLNIAINLGTTCSLFLALS